MTDSPLRKVKVQLHSFSHIKSIRTQHFRLCLHPLGTRTEFLLKCRLLLLRGSRPKCYYCPVMERIPFGINNPPSPIDLLCTEKAGCFLAVRLIPSEHRQSWLLFLFESFQVIHSMRLVRCPVLHSAVGTCLYLDCFTRLGKQH